VVRCVVNCALIVALWLCAPCNVQIYDNLCKSVHSAVRSKCRKVETQKALRNLEGSPGSPLSPVSATRTFRKWSRGRRDMELILQMDRQIQAGGQSGHSEHCGQCGSTTAGATPFAVGNVHHDSSFEDLQPDQVTEVLKPTNLREMNLKHDKTGAVTPLNSVLTRAESLRMRNEMSPPVIPGLKEMVRDAIHGHHGHHKYGQPAGQSQRGRAQSGPTRQNKRKKRTKQNRARFSNEPYQPTHQTQYKYDVPGHVQYGHPTSNPTLSTIYQDDDSEDEFPIDVQHPYDGFAD